MGMNDAARVGAHECDWVRAHEALSRLARQRAAADAEEGRWLLCAWRSSAHVHLGHASFSEYIERIFGYKPRTTQEKLRVAEALEQLPRLARLLETGALGWCAVRELTRVAVPDTEQAWIVAAQDKTTRELETLVAGKSPGDDPAAPSSNRPRHHVLRFEVAPETFALFRDAMQRLRRATGGSLDDDATLLSMARQVLAGPGDDGRASYQISLTVCAVCGSGGQQGGGELVPVGAEIVTMANCDAQHLGQLLPRAANENASGANDARGRTEPDELRSGARVGAETAEHADADRDATDALIPPASASPAEKAAAAVTDVTAAVGRDARSGARPRPRAKQSIPPALRRAVLARDQHRCRVPGCTHATFVDVHHIRPRSEGGRNVPENLLTICSAHHRAVHRGELSIEPSGQGGVCFRHADGTAYGQVVTPHAVDAQAKVFSALRNLGFREREIRAVLAELRSDPDLRQATAKSLLHEALRRIRPTPKSTG